MSLKAAIQAFREPIPREKQRLLEDRWAVQSDAMRGVGQSYGRQSLGCGATIGAMPRCDFDCQGCYLGKDANQMTRKPLEEILKQIDDLRTYLGPKGNLQITDGEVTLLPTDELLAMIRHARAVGLLPMLMTHGDTFRREPELLPRLVTEGGLMEVSIHIDCLQQGRRGIYAGATSEAQLMPLRQEMADMIRQVRRQTGKHLRAATTLTVSQDNLAEIPEVVRWTFDHRDVFQIISMQPLAQVGRTRDGLEGVTPDVLWRAIDQALAPVGFDGSRRTPLQFGHPDCTRVEPFGVLARRGETPQIIPVARAGSEDDKTFLETYYESGLVGINFRDDPLPVRLARALGCLHTAPRWILGPALRWASQRAKAIGTSLPGLAFDIARGQIRPSSFLVVSHHFMDAEVMATPKGQERLAGCVFRVPVGDRMEPMCRVNAGGLRDQVYAGEVPEPVEAVHGG